MLRITHGAIKGPCHEDLHTTHIFIQSTTALRTKPKYIVLK
jgi:hypothetical protein